MSPETTALVHFVVIVSVWLFFPLVPAIATYWVTPDQKIGLRGPLEGMTVRATGSFAAYLVVAAVLSQFAWPVGKALVGKVAGDTTWVITGTAALYDADGRPVTQMPNALRSAYVRVLPDPNVIDTNLSIKVPFSRDVNPTIFIDVPGWGGGRISLQDEESFNTNALLRHIQLKNEVQIRQQPEKRLSVGEESP